MKIRLKESARRVERHVLNGDLRRTLLNENILAWMRRFSEDLTRFTSSAGPGAWKGENSGFIQFHYPVSAIPPGVWLFDMSIVRKFNRIHMEPGFLNWRAFPAKYSFCYG